MRRSVACVVAALTALAATVASPAAAALEPPSTPGATAVPPSWPRPPALTADAYLLVDADTGQTLAARRPDEDRAVASTVKVLTAITVLERAEPSDRITAGQEVTGFAADAAGVGLEPGETWTVDDLLEGLVARSGNDAANALAVALGGTIGGFVELMRNDAAAVGVQGRLTSPTGLDDGNRLSARDLVTLTRVALADPQFAAIAARPRVDLPDLGTVESRNRLLGDYAGAYGVKTGFTDESGRCLIAAAARGDRRLIAVVLGSDGPTDHFADARALLDFGFGQLRPVTVAGDGPEVEVRVPGGWAQLEAADAQASAPDPAAVEFSLEPPIEADADPGPISATWRGVPLVTLDLTTTDVPPDPTDAGGWLADRVYAAMRAAVAADVWSEVGG